MFWSLVLLSLAINAVQPMRLEMAVAIFRHGDRTPLFIYKTDAHRAYWEQQGLGQLTDLGEKQEFHLGTMFRRRYIDSGFMSSTYKSSELYLRSTNVPRTLASARCVLAGLYSSNSNKVHCTTNVPVNTVPLAEDSLLPRHYGDPKCCNYKKQILKDFYILDQMDRENQAFYSELSQNTGNKINSLSAPNLQDTLFVEKAHNLTMPSWYSQSTMDKLTSITDTVLYYSSNTDEKRYFFGGRWAEEVMKLFELKEDERTSQKLRLYSAHDTTVSFMMATFGMYGAVGYRKPCYSGAFILELYSYDDDYWVKFFYHDETWSSEFIQLIHPECDGPEGSCELEDVDDFVEDYKVEDQEEWLEECEEDCD